MSLLCPSCKTDLVMSDRQGVEIDYCPQCRGVWLDRGELDKILERAEARPGQSPAGAQAVNTSLFGGAPAAPRSHNPQHIDNDRHYDPRRDSRRRDDDDDDDDDRRKYGHPPRRKSWLSDIFD